MQNLVVRDYAARKGLRYLLSVVEHAMPGSYMILADALGALESLDGIVVFSAFMLPPEPQRRAQIYARFFETKTALHAALENLVIAAPADVERFESMLLVAGALERTPFGGRYEKTDEPLRAGTASDRALLAAAER